MSTESVEDVPQRDNKPKEPGKPSGFDERIIDDILEETNKVQLGEKRNDEKAEEEHQASSANDLTNEEINLDETGKSAEKKVNDEWKSEIRYSSLKIILQECIQCYRFRRSRKTGRNIFWE